MTETIGQYRGNGAEIHNTSAQVWKRINNEITGTRRARQPLARIKAVLLNDRTRLTPYRPSSIVDRAAAVLIRVSTKSRSSLSGDFLSLRNSG